MTESFYLGTFDEVHAYHSTFRANKRRSTPIFTDFVIGSFTLEAFSRSVSQIWDWDLPVGQVRFTRATALAAVGTFSKVERYSLEQLVWEGWDLPAVWYRANQDPDLFSAALAAPIHVKLDLGLRGFAWITEGIDFEPLPYHRVFWVPEPSGDSERLDVILTEHARFKGYV